MVQVSIRLQENTFKIGFIFKIFVRRADPCSKEGVDFLTAWPYSVSSKTVEVCLETFSLMFLWEWSCMTLTELAPHWWQHSLLACTTQTWIHCPALEVSSNSLILPVLNNTWDLLSRNALCYLVMISRKAANNTLQGTNKMCAKHLVPKELKVKYKDQEYSA